MGITAGFTFVSHTRVNNGTVYELLWSQVTLGTARGEIKVLIKFCNL